MYDPSPKITKIIKNGVTYGYKDQYFLMVEFTDPDTGEDLIGGFSLLEWHKPPSDEEIDIRERL